MVIPSGQLQSSLAENSATMARRRPGFFATINTLVLCYTFLGCIVGYDLVLTGRGLTATVGIALIAHTTVWSAMLTHEFMHATIFRSPRMNRVFGVATTVLSGAWTVSYDLLRQQHLDHHRFHVGYDGFSITRCFLSLPIWLRMPVAFLEFFYIPVLGIMARTRSLTAPFLKAEHRHLRRRMVIVIAIQSAFYLVVFLLHPLALLWFIIAQLLVITIFRVFDCYHHTFEIIPRGASAPRLSRDYELSNTYSSLFSRRWYWLNAVFLNYGYHNAHHFRPAAHWLDLPLIDRRLYTDSSAHCIEGFKLLYWYHRNRIKRIYNGLGRPVVTHGELRIDRFWGILMNISFIDYDV